MKVYLIYKLSQASGMTMAEAKDAHNKFELWTKSDDSPGGLCWFEYGTDGTEIWSIGVTEETDEELHRTRLPDNESGLLGEGVDLLTCNTDRTFLFEK